MGRISDMHKKWMKEPKYGKAFEALEEEFILASAVIDSRSRAGNWTSNTRSAEGKTKEGFQEIVSIPISLTALQLFDVKKEH